MIQEIKALKKLNVFLDRRQKAELAVLGVLFVVEGILQLISISVLIPYMAQLMNIGTNGKSVYENDQRLVWLKHAESGGNLSYHMCVACVCNKERVFLFGGAARKQVCKP